MIFNRDNEKNSLTVSLSGEIDHHSAFAVRSEIDRLVALHRPGVLYLDLSAITFCDSSGLGLIMGRHKLMQESGGELVLLSPPKAVMRIIELSGMNKYIKFERSEENVEATAG